MHERLQLSIKCINSNSIKCYLLSDLEYNVLYMC